MKFHYDITKLELGQCYKFDFYESSNVLINKLHFKVEKFIIDKVNQYSSTARATIRLRAPITCSVENVEILRHFTHFASKKNNHIDLTKLNDNSNNTDPYALFYLDCRDYNKDRTTRSIDVYHDNVIRCTDCSDANMWIKLEEKLNCSNVT